MSPWLVLSLIALYFGVLILISKFTAKSGGNDEFFLGNRQSPWYVVAFGMIGTSLSGVTFISVPGWVANSQFSYMQMVLGYLLGYAVIALVLMPMYYRLQLTSIYSYFQDRFGNLSYKTAAACFLLSRIVGAAFRLYLVAVVLNYAVVERFWPSNIQLLEEYGIDLRFPLTVIITIVLIFLYTAKGGIKTIIWTDTLQTAFMLTAVGVTVYLIGSYFGWSLSEIIDQVQASEYSKVWFFEDIKDARFFWKNFLGGMFITIVMTGMDQDMMQKNLSCRNIGEAQKNMFGLSFTLVIVNLMFLSLGVLLYKYAAETGMTLPEKADELYPMIALDGGLGIVVGILFILGLIAAAYSSADSALAALTTSVCVDFIDIQHKPEQDQIKIRKRVHLSLSAVLVGVILIFKSLDNSSIISDLFKAAGYTYGPLLGMFAFGMMTKRKIKDQYIIPIAIVAPLLTYAFAVYAPQLITGYQTGFELILINGLIMFAGLWSISNNNHGHEALDI
ncbi:MAG: sodium:solute symporter [Crocinitomicaceae bacterium]|nr:sodium:solute symporter [Crocinitomicaceae bacterium]|tara:strand:+ start:1406 stop:2914 length:1509 start_codon:yes stop_codon:yes gene_type:complete